MIRSSKDSISLYQRGIGVTCFLMLVTYIVMFEDTAQRIVQQFIECLTMPLLEHKDADTLDKEPVGKIFYFDTFYSDELGDAYDE